MKTTLLLILGISSAIAHAACEDMYIWARILQPGVCTPRTEYEKREIRRNQKYEQEAAVNDGIRRNAYRELTRATLAKIYKVPVSDVTVDSSGMYSISHGQYVCQETEW